MDLPRTPLGRLQAVLWLVAVHSAAVGIGLVVQPDDIFDRMGFAPIGEPFFPAQGGIFHVVMAVGYALAAWRPRRNESLVVFTIVVKIMATTFLMTYYLAVSPMPTVLLSGLTDGAMGAAIAIAYHGSRRELASEGT